MIANPVHWYQAPSPLMLMVDRLVFVDEAVQQEARTVGKAVASFAKALRRGELQLETSPPPKPRPK